MPAISAVAAITLGLLCAAMALCSAPALAAAPEAPVTEAPAPIAGTSATLKGELNPGTSEEAVAYHFAYSPGASAGCTESGLVAPGEPFPEASGQHTEVTEPVSGLEGSTEYTVCLIAANPAEPGEATQGSSVKFETLASKPVVGPESASAVTPFAANLQAEVNPEKQSTTCAFEYGKVVTEHKVACEVTPLTGNTPQIATLTVSGLKPGTTYHYRVAAKNGSGEQKGTEEEFETIAPPSEVETGNAESVTSTSAFAGGELNAGGEATYYIEYGTAPCSGETETCGTKSTELAAGGRTKEPVGSIELSDLEPGVTYHYWLVADNAAVTKPVHGAAKEFTTGLLAPSEVETGSATGITETGAEIGGALNPGGEARYYIEYGPSSCATTTCEKSAELVMTGEAQASIAPIALSGLEPNTIYYYWLSAKNGVAEPIHGEPSEFATLETPAEAEAEAAVRRRPEEELAAAAAAKAKAAEEARHQEEAAAASAAAQQRKYEEITAVTALDERQQEEAKRNEELIAATSVKIVKVKVGAAGVQVTIKTSQPGRVTVAGAGLRKAVVKLNAGTRTVKLALSRAGRAARRHRKRITLSASLATSLTTVSATKAIRL